MNLVMNIDWLLHIRRRFFNYICFVASSGRVTVNDELERKWQGPIWDNIPKRAREIPHANLEQSRTLPAQLEYCLCGSRPMYISAFGGMEFDSTRKRCNDQECFCFCYTRYNFHHI